MGIVFHLEKRTRGGKFTYLDVSFPAPRGREHWKITLDHSTGAGSALRVWNDPLPEKAEDQNGRMETAPGHDPGAADSVLGLPVGPNPPKITM